LTGRTLTTATAGWHRRPEMLEELLRSARDSHAIRNVVPGWCGVDLLRGWAFYLVRADRHMGGGTLDQEWQDVLTALRNHPDADAEDRPPPPLPTGGFALPTVFSDEPKRHKDAQFLVNKKARLWEPHVAPINRFVDGIRKEIAAELPTIGSGHATPSVHVPYVDPDSGGTQARVLFVLESPAGPAALGSGMLSADNNDETAKNVWLAYRESGMPRTLGLHWNAVPWYVGNGRKNASVTRAQVKRGRRYLLQLVDLTPDLRVVLALGKHAQASIEGVAAELERRGIRVIEAPHPGPIQAGVTKGQSLLEVFQRVAQARRIAEDR
jgi:uracil-DNA glycosylase